MKSEHGASANLKYEEALTFFIVCISATLPAWMFYIKILPAAQKTNLYFPAQSVELIDVKLLKEHCC